ncbi:PREDICTED: abscisic acid receptor PYL12-like [Nicotiana attenuata]|uniref:Abscisic acid receptor pyl4 n=1 Tax=Nicotiana attenuata TaxID=49451 RepID=A0A1J6KXL5_NICAT|nr:PREDICTED: abscisic acid receptor PYL12-like [Nicotiana attenuata]OIT26383.1 abscisic acid receptor pyl4 [Nicotiana attenuata]
MVKLYHTHELSPKQWSSMPVQTIDAPLPLVWSFVRKFDKPQCYKNFIGSCTLLSGDGGVGSIREVTLVSGFPGKKSIERFDFLDDDMHVSVFSVVEADHSFLNFKSTITLHEDKEEEEEDDEDKVLRTSTGKSTNKTVVIESYVVDIPENSCKDDTCEVTDNILRWHHRSLAWVAENMATSGVSSMDLKKTEIPC